MIDPSMNYKDAALGHLFCVKLFERKKLKFSLPHYFIYSQRVLMGRLYFD